jgi:hypothetical protein
MVALASLWFGYYVICYHNKHELPVQLTVVSLAGGLLLWEMIKSFRFKTSLPKTFKPIKELEYPAPRLPPLPSRKALSPPSPASVTKKGRPKTFPAYPLKGTDMSCAADGSRF